jgi:hypothetical protein
MGNDLGEMMNVIYCIENLEDNKKYIGLTCFFKKRIAAHVNALNNNKHGNIYLQRAWNKYGKNNFKIYIICICTNYHILNEMERFFIKMFKTYDDNFGYNLTFGGDSEKRTEIAIKDLINFWTKLRGKKILQYDKEGNFIKEFESISQASKEIKKGKRDISRILNKEIGTCGGYQWRYYKENYLLKIDSYNIIYNGMKKVIQYTKDMEYIRDFKSLKEGSDIIGVHYTSIARCCTGKKKKIKGYIFRFQN